MPAKLAGWYVSSQVPASLPCDGARILPVRRSRRCRAIFGSPVVPDVASSSMNSRDRFFEIWVGSIRPSSCRSASTPYTAREDVLNIDGWRRRSNSICPIVHATIASANESVLAVQMATRPYGCREAAKPVARSCRLATETLLPSWTISACLPNASCAALWLVILQLAYKPASSPSVRNSMNPSENGSWPVNISS